MNNRILASSIFSLMIPVCASAVVLLDNTNNLSVANLSTSSATSYGSNSTAYNRINGYVFSVGSTSFEMDAVSIALKYSSTISPTIRVTVWELGATGTTPAAAPVVYTEDFIASSVGSVSSYFTFSPGTEVVLEADTRYAIGFSTDWTTNSSFLQWLGYSPLGSKPTGSEGLSSLSSGSGFFSTNGGSSYSTSSMVYSLQLTGSPVAVPEPSSASGAAGLIALGFVAKRRRRS